MKEKLSYCPNCTTYRVFGTQQNGVPYCTRCGWSNGNPAGLVIGLGLLFCALPIVFLWVLFNYSKW